ncbi:thioredoxin family protein [Amycolatopsis rhabdoformis]|uniref:Thioredoxin family protein n=1 Tax=Amycolatopsis rhabdoformis TaxID=1448059 RepID=A0ABZ1IJ81_9PSEU|nr:thioredoxin family protein [Amycolatopsis rhabdoformis]WSE33604.1 thioredoxin family protein [Amycolatopsis rhabdoformis]
MQKIDTAGFDTAISATPRTLVLFTAPWCTVCRNLEPDARQFAEDNAWNVTVHRVVIDDDPGLATRFGVQSVPSALLFVDGEPGALIQPRRAGDLAEAVAKALS